MYRLVPYMSALLSLFLTLFGQITFAAEPSQKVVEVKKVAIQGNGRLAFDADGKLLFGVWTLSNGVYSATFESVHLSGVSYLPNSLTPVDGRSLQKFDVNAESLSSNPQCKMIVLFNRLEKEESPLQFDLTDSRLKCD
jgi:hypothetical protein